MNLAYILILSILGYLAPSVPALGSSFVTKTGNGFERLVVSIDERLAVPPPVSSSPSSSSSSPTSPTLSSSSGSPPVLAGAGTTGSKGATQECQKVLEQLKALITRTSEYLFEATNGQTYFRQVSILLPSTWANSNCTGEPGDQRHYQYKEEVSTATYQTPNSADIHVTADHPVYIDKPWTLQYGPCGVPGKKITIPISFISEQGNTDTLRGRFVN